MKIKDMLYALWEKATDDTGWLSLNDYIKYRRKNGWVCINIDNMPKPTSSDIIGTLPEGFRPIDIYPQYFIRSNYSSTTIAAWITPSGQINVSRTDISSSTSTISGFMVYPV